MIHTKFGRFYFTTETEDAIVDYNNEEDPIIRNEIYERHIYFPFIKIAENLIHTYKMYYFDLPPDDVKKDVAAYLTTKLGNYSKDKGKAFSYFSVVAKNWLILHNNSNYKERKKFKSIDSFSQAEENRRMEELLEGARRTISDEQRETLKVILFKLADFLENEIDFIFKNERDKNITYAIINILRRYDKINIYKKKALYVLIREYSGENTNYITKVLKKITTYKNKIVDTYGKGAESVLDLVLYS